MKDESCIFCKIANGEIPSSTIYEDENFRVILDLGPAIRGHALILPKEHFADVCALPDGWAAKVLPLGAKIGAAMKKRSAAPVSTWSRTTESPPDRRSSISICT